MILVLEPNTRPEGLDYRMLTTQLERLPNVTFPRPSGSRQRGDADRDLPDRQHRRADGRADAGAAVRGQGRARVGAVPRARPSPAGRRPAGVVRVQRRAVRPGQRQRVRRAVRRRFARVGRSDDEGAARPRPGLHADGRVQAAHVAVCVPGLRRKLPAVRVRARRQVRHPRDLDGSDARIARRRDPRARSRRPATRRASCCRSARATRRTSSC